MITLGFQNGNIIASIVNTKSEEDFKICCSVLKNQKFQWNPELKSWTKSAVLYNNDLYDVLKIVTDVYFPDTAKRAIEQYEQSLPSELIVGPDIPFLNYSLYSDYPPYKGKPPYEQYQDEDIRRALKQNRFLFAWKMGLGKSYATSIIYEYLRMHKNVQKMILITSRIGSYNLAGELGKFCKHIDGQKDVLVFNSPKSFKKFGHTIFDNEEVYEKNVLIFSYDSWKLVAKAYGDTPRSRTLHIPLESFYKEYPRLICLDECHYLSNPKSDRSKFIFKYLRSFTYRYLFSATPADKPEKLYSICTLLDPKLVRYMKYDDWIHKYNDVGTWFSKYAINKKKWHQEDLELLNQELAQYSVKREVKDCLDLPPLSTKVFYTEMSEKQTNLYKELVNDIVNNILKKSADRSAASIDVVREAFSTVMSFVENPLVSGNNTGDTFSEAIKNKCRKYNYAKDYAKLDIVSAILEDEFEHDKRGIIWYVHPLTKDVLSEACKQYNPIIVDATLSEEERFKQVAEFKRNPEHKILIASQNILASSLTINEATFAIYLETLFSYLDYEQSTGRIYRIGQQEDVHLYHIYYKDSVDMFHQIILNQKKDLVQMLFSAKERPIMSLQEMKNLFEGKGM